MKRQFFLVLLVLLALFGGCIFDSDEDKKSSDNGTNVEDQETNGSEEQVIASVTVTPDSTGAIVGGADVQLTAEVLDNLGAVVDTTVVWSLSDSTLASIDSSGLLTALTVGEVNVIASVGDVSDTAIVTITEPEQGRYYSKSLGFSIKFPEDWETHEDYEGVPVISMSPRESLTDSFRENVNVVTEDLPSDMNVDEYYQQGLNMLKVYITDFTLIDSGQVYIDKTKAKWHISTYMFGTVNIKAMQYLLVNNKKGYIITCTASTDTFEKYRSTFENIALSFNFENSDVVAKNIIMVKTLSIEKVQTELTTFSLKTGAKCLKRL